MPPLPRGESPIFFLVTCEHGGNRVPAPYAGLFVGSRRVLGTHRALDRGALELALRFAAGLDAPLVSSTVTRLLVDLNRSLGRRTLFSEFTGKLDDDARDAILDRHYHPYRRRVEAMAAEAIDSGSRVLHVSVHTFTPVLKGRVRRADVGLLYDPSRRGERQLSRAWRAALLAVRPDLAVRCNYPYRGTADGLTTHLRRRFGPRHYAGIELEVNQRWPAAGGRHWLLLQQDLVQTFPAPG